VIGVEPESAPTLTYALKAGQPVDSPAGAIAADSLAPERVGELMFPIAQQSVDRVVLVSNGAIHNAQQAVWDRVRIVAEPGDAAALAAVLSDRYVPQKSERVAIVLCGGNTTAVDFNDVLNDAIAAQEVRLVRLSGTRIDVLHSSRSDGTSRKFCFYSAHRQFVFLSGHIAKTDGKPWIGKLGSDLTTDQGNSPPDPSPSRC
jgi:threonine synthase